MSDHPVRDAAQNLAHCSRRAIRECGPTPFLDRKFDRSIHPPDRNRKRSEPKDGDCDKEEWHVRDSIALRVLPNRPRPPR